MALVGTGATEPKDALYFEKEARVGNLKKIIGFIAEGYDYAIIDSPAGMGSIAAVLLAMSNSVLIPINCRTLAIKTLPSSLNLTKQIREKLKPDLRLEGVLITMLDDQNSSELRIREELKASFPEAAFFETIIPFDGQFEKSNASAVPVAMIPEAKEAARSYMDLALEMKIRELQDMTRGAADEEFQGLF
jgi:chromosome partitioning protein